MLLSYMALVAASGRLPEIMIVFVSPGCEGGTLLLCDLMNAVWGTGHAVAPPSILQTAEEFRKQGNLYRGMKWIPPDESRPTVGVEEDVFKIFVSGGDIFLRETTKPKPILPGGRGAGRRGLRILTMCLAPRARMNRRTGED